MNTIGVLIVILQISDSCLTEKATLANQTRVPGLRSKGRTMHGRWEYQDNTCVFVKKISNAPAPPSDPLGCRNSYSFGTFANEPYRTHMASNIKETLQNVCCSIESIAFTERNVSKISVKYKVDFIFPVLAYTSSSLVHGYRFIPMLDPPGAFYISAKQQVLVSTLCKECVKLWPLLVVSIFLSMVAGFIIWILEMRSNEEEFPRSFFRGWFEGTWWSIISMTTVGYGDKSPKSIAGRLFGTIWIIIGIIVFCILAGELTTVILNAKRGDEHSMIQKRVGTLDRLYDKSQVARYGGILSSTNKTVYNGEKEQLRDLINRMHKGNIDGILMDKFAYSYMKDELEKREDKVLNWFFDDMVITDIPHSGKDVNYGALLKPKQNADVYKKFKPIFEDNKLAFQSSVSLQFSATPESILEDFDDDEFYEDIFHDNAFFILITMVIILLLGIAYETCRSKKLKD